VCMLALLGLATGPSTDDPAVQLWMLMVFVQSVPYLATVVTACLSAVSQRVRATKAAPIAPPTPAPEPVLPKAA
ncbi:MAG: hypothetical protein JO294_05045, partial [Alphaproteobacteria bacterium]|nr:hypothetical protein [Alphaproteobacteria bacterium]